ncbi:MAG: OmpA family protein [Endozoicomonas sp.]
MRFSTPDRLFALLLITVFLTGCARDGNMSKWSKCALIGAGMGGLLGTTDSGESAGWGALGGAILGGVLCGLQDRDSDEDGVFDSKDHCPGTFPGTEVDVTGCPLDSDNDGVVNTMDRCPDTPYGTVVNAEGCPDTDNDGIADHIDQCPHTPARVAVDDYGCPLDSDGDGVADGMNLCPNTPTGAPVNDRGCALNKELGTIYFEFDSSVLTEKARNKLDKIAMMARNQADKRLLVTGFTDSSGKIAYNRLLSKRRADSVKTYLVNAGVTSNRIEAKAGGVIETGNQTHEGRIHNRHVDISVIE